MLTRVGIFLLRRPLDNPTPHNPERVWIPRVLTCVRGLTIAVIGALALIAAGGMSTVAQAQSLGEDDVKAAFVLKLMNFVQWPNSSTKDLVIGFIGADSISDSLQRLASGTRVNGRRVVVRRLGLDGDFKSCQVIFLGDSERKNASSVLERVRGTSVLTVGESDGFSQRGGIVNLLLNNGRIRFEVNPHGAERAHLQISSRLLSLATIVADGS
jgi:hypothetical protein